MPIFGGKMNREEKKNTVLEKLMSFFNKYFGLLGSFHLEQTHDIKPFQYYTEDLYSGKAAEEESEMW